MNKNITMEKTYVLIHHLTAKEFVIVADEVKKYLPSEFSQFFRNGDVVGCFNDKEFSFYIKQEETPKKKPEQRSPDISEI